MPVSSQDVSMPRINTELEVVILLSQKSIRLIYTILFFTNTYFKYKYILNKIKGPHFMTTIKVKDNEPFEVAMRRFKRTIEKTGLLTELRANEFYEKPTAERKRKLAAAVKRTYKRLRSQLLPPKLY